MPCLTSPLSLCSCHRQPQVSEQRVGEAGKWDKGTIPILVFTCVSVYYVFFALRGQGEHKYVLSESADVWGSDQETASLL